MNRRPTGIIVSPSASIEDLRKICALVAAHFREEHRQVLESNKEDDNAVVWLSGLMGAGIFSVQAFLATAPAAVLLCTFLPWTLGILSGMCSRLVTRGLTRHLIGEHLGRVTVLDMMQFEADPTKIRSVLVPLINWSTDPKERDKKARRLLKVADFAFYATHILLVLGTVAAVVTFWVMR
jgi:hypothetical protein